MTLNVAILVFFGLIGLAVGSVIMTRLAQRRGDLMHFPNVSNHRPDPLIQAWAIILGFVLITALSGFNSAQSAAANEANAVISMAHNALILPAPLRDDIEQNLVCYSRYVARYDWVPSARSDDGGEFGGSMYVDAVANNISENLSRASAVPTIRDSSIALILGSEDQLRQARSDRLNGDYGLPGMLWVMILLASALIIVVGAIISVRERLGYHLFISVGGAIVIGLAVVLTTALNNPFSNTPPLPVVQPVAMQRALNAVLTLAPNPNVGATCPAPTTTTAAPASQ